MHLPGDAADHAVVSERVRAGVRAGVSNVSDTYMHEERANMMQSILTPLTRIYTLTRRSQGVIHTPLCRTHPTPTRLSSSSSTLIPILHTHTTSPTNTHTHTHQQVPHHCGHVQPARA